MKRHRAFCAPFVFLICLSVLAGCASQYEPSGFFASYGLLEPGPYFKQEFTEPLANFEKYKKIRLRPVIFDYMDKECEYELGPGEKEYLMERFNASMKSALEKKFSLVAEETAMSPDTLIVEPALVFVRKPERLINTISSLLILVPLTSGSAALEVKLMDASTGKVVAEVAEKRTGAGGLGPILIGPFTKFDQIEAIFDRWAKYLTLFIASQKYIPVSIHG